MTAKKHTGHILIMLLVVIAIGLMLYYADIMWMGGGGRMTKAEKAENKPWANEALIKDPNKSVRVIKPSPKSTKPVIEKMLSLKGDVTASGAKRGQITFTIQPDGTIAGNWQCQYSYTHAAYVIAATFQGNTDNTQAFAGDPSKLYLIASGEFTQKATNLENGEVTETKGAVYLNGWLGRDLDASGKISITTDKRWHADYNWTAISN